MKPRLVYIHGNQTTHWSECWAGLFKAELEKLGFETFFETFPDSILARAEYWLPFVEKHIKAGENDVLIGWSSGATTAMRYAESHKIHSSILISPSYTDLGDEMEKQSGLFDKPWDWEAIKKNQKYTALIYSDNDPYIPQDQFEFIARKLKAETMKIPSAKHFTERQNFPELLDYIKKTYAKSH